jgi:hypothetical protein
MLVVMLELGMQLDQLMLKTVIKSLFHVVGAKRHSTYQIRGTSTY